MSILSKQYTQAWASLKKKPGLILAVVGTMSVTLGALLCSITLSYLLLVEPLPYPEQERLFVADHRILDAENTTKTVAFSYPTLVQLYKNNDAFEKSAMIYYGQDVITSHEKQPLVNVAFATPELFRFLSPSIQLGRMFEETEGLDKNNPVAILNYSTWKEEYSGRRDILDQKITIAGVSYRIIGVLSNKFVEPELYNIGRKTHVWLPWDFNHASFENKESYTNINSNFTFVGKLKSGLHQEQANQLLTPLISERWQQGVSHMGFFKNWSVKVELRQLKSVVLGDSGAVSSMLLIGVIGLALIACVNISNLFMARTAEKQRQMAIQAALGATKGHLFKATLAEIGILMVMSILLALIIAQLGFYFMQKYLSTVLPRIEELSLNMITLGMAVFLCVSLAILFSKLSTRLVNYRALNLTLQSSGKGSGLQVSKRTRQVLIASQISLATVLVFANITLFKDSVSAISAPNGFETDDLTTVMLNLTAQDSPSSEEITPIMAEMMEKLESLPQVETIAHSSSPLDGFGIKALTVDNKKYTPYFKRVDERYFDMIQQPLIQGDNFTLVDRKDDTRAVIVNQAFANQLKSDGDVIGMRLESIGEPEFKVIGIVRSINIPGETGFGSDVTAGEVPRVYAASGLSGQTFMLKLKPDQSISREILARTIGEVDSRYGVYNYVVASEALTKRLFVEITTTVLTAALALLVLTLAGVGIYGILSYGTQLRRFELGTRMAIGATRSSIISLVVTDNAKPVISGVIASIILLAITYVAASDYVNLFFTVQAVPMILLTVTLILLVVLFACYWPLKPCINSQPIHSLRANE
jgi:predicted permease